MIPDHDALVFRRRRVWIKYEVSVRAEAVALDDDSAGQAVTGSGVRIIC